MDRMTKEQRHKTMSHIRSKDTTIEVKLRKALWHKGFRYRKNYKALPGTPDIALTKYKIAVFCDSEFFHGKDWEILKPKLEVAENSDYWIKKITRNRERDIEIDKELLFLGWTVIHFWGKDILKKTDECIKVIEDAAFNVMFGEMPLENDDY
ncbi:very short patch repair endonuclease [Parasporobacterium paucivorans]|uniref:T/G mismatch-specific endonuclease n=1 Tax=Parasporobacterium paucivorans DSM 15970 TaxID=1122934 RepID=A0A1M6J700_9FIRM|nr:very short patch repair endonuclease [Parasporobacterium paucivorans]SHJ42503.1 T/G mismatch-specific endonuclease [Parasporobacterium paucivorans DSM 15970]